MTLFDRLGRRVNLTAAGVLLLEYAERLLSLAAEAQTRVSGQDGLTGSLSAGRRASGRSGRRNRFGPVAIFGLFIAAGWVLPGRRRVVLYSIQTLMRLKPALFRQDLVALFDLLQQRKVKPLIARRFPLAEARQAHELLGKGGVSGKIVLDMPSGPVARDPTAVSSGRLTS